MLTKPAILVIFLLALMMACPAKAQYGGPPMWQQMPPPGAYGAPPGVLQSDGPYGPGSQYNAPGMSGEDSGPQPWMQQAPPVPQQGPMGPPGDPWSDGGELLTIQWSVDDGWGDPRFPAFGGPQPQWGGADFRDRYGVQPGDRSGDYPAYWNAYPQSNAPQPNYPTAPDSPYEDGYSGL